jgi:putative oxygen-independent coproporphyrinogen III oxidase
LTSIAEPGRPAAPLEPRAPLQAPPLGLYVHLPWCVRKCPYCDFNSHPAGGAIPAGKYVNALLADLDGDAPRVRDRVVSSVYFGGGTPSLFAAAQIARLVAGFGARLDLSPEAEITLEANPGTVERDSFAAYRDAGVNRVSLGVQSFDDGLLRGIGRIHTGTEVRGALASLREAGLANFNIDLMYGLPGQSVAQAVTDIETAIAAGPVHVSHYQLTLEPNTGFAAHPPSLPPDDSCWEMQECAGTLLDAAGYRQYEISAWARPAGACRHNLNYWRYGDYLGIGAGAHGKLTDAARGEIRRSSRPRHPRRYLAGDAGVEAHTVGPDERAFEFFLNGLRLREGISPRAFGARTGLPWTHVSDRVGDALAKGLLEPCGHRYVPTALGWRFVNETQALFLP